MSFATRRAFRAGKRAGSRSRSRGRRSRRGFSARQPMRQRLGRRF